MVNRVYCLFLRRGARRHKAVAFEQVLLPFHTLEAVQAELENTGHVTGQLLFVRPVSNGRREVHDMVERRFNREDVTKIFVPVVPLLLAPGA